MALLDRAGIHVAEHASDAEDALRAVDANRPDAAILDVRLAPTHTDEGVRAAHAIRRRHPGTGIVLLSEQVETSATSLAREPAQLGYLLTSGVTDAHAFAAAVHQVAGGGSVLDPRVASGLIDAVHSELRNLTDREREVLARIGQGLSNRAIAEQLAISPSAVEKHVTTIFAQLALPDTGREDRRVLAALAYARG
jgi:serine/threonine-protein kinase